MKGTVNGLEYRQTLVRLQGACRLYIKLQMLEKSTEKIGEIISHSIGYDPEIRTIEAHPKLQKALEDNRETKKVFDLSQCNGPYRD